MQTKKYPDAGIGANNGVPRGDGHGPIVPQNGGNGQYQNGNNPNIAIFATLPEREQELALASVAESRPGGGAGLAIQSLADLLQQDFPPLTFLVDGILALGHLLFLAGRPKSGKSWLVLQLAMAIDRGLPFLGRTTRPGRVLYIALEDGARRVYQRSKTLKWQPKQAAVTFQIANFDIDGLPGPGLEQIEMAALDGYDLIIVDTLIASLSGNVRENDNGQMGAIVNRLAKIAHDTNTAVVVVHHTRKGAADDIFDLLRGAGALRGGYDVGLLLERKQGEREALLHCESRDIELEPITIRQSDDGAGWEALGDATRIHEIRAGRRIVEAIMEHGEGHTAEELAELLGISKSATHKQLKNAERDGWVRREQAEITNGKPADHWFLSNRGVSNG